MHAWLSPPHLNYRQTVLSTGHGEGKIVRESLGKGFYAHVELSVRPLPHYLGFEFVEADARTGVGWRLSNQR